MQRVFIFVLLSAVICIKAGAEESTDARQALVVQFSQALGLEQMVTSMREKSQASIASTGEPLIDNMRKSGISETVLTEMRGYYQETMNVVLSSWTAEEAVRIYVQAIAASMTNDDLRKSVAFYKSEEGQHSVMAASSAVAQLQNYIENATSQALQQALPAFIEKVKAVAVRERQSMEKVK